MSWKDLKNSLSTTYQKSQKKLETLSDEQIKGVEGNDEKNGIMENYINHIQTQMKLKLGKRQPFYDKYGGAWVGLRFPSKNPELDNPSTYGEPKVAKNGAKRWWGPRYAMMNNSVVTVFFPEEWKQGKGGQFGYTNEKTHQFIFVYRGNLDEEYRWIDDAKGTYSRKEAVFLNEATERYGRPIKSIDEVDIGDLGQRSFTFNPNQVIKVLK